MHFCVCLPILPAVPFQYTSPHLRCYCRVIRLILRDPFTLANLVLGVSQQKL